ncbi:rano class II histocompatibility antigen, A beta chain-like isoform X2 [Pempheris klunzingeri]|uniref:rano class II histocompatibility antigen, A beta chain-like isoform X2 n=1 Tax=Pempheris klunzingeri TaxID=3127111 RepID=UPI00397EDD99
MFQALGFFTLLLAFLRADAFFGHILIHCQFTSPDGHDAVYLEQFYFNKKLMAQYNSTLGKIIGYTKKAQELADILNKDVHLLKHEKWKTDLCKRNAPLAYDGLLTPVEPYVWLRSVKAASSRHPGLLVCSVYNFYPRQIRVTWLRNGKGVTSDVTSTEELSNGNWLYQIHSYLEFTPIPGEKITCMVEHASLMEPKLYDWEPMADSMTYKITVGTAGLLLGLTFLVAGLIYYKKRSTVRVLVPTTEVLYPEHTL